MAKKTDCSNATNLDAAPQEEFDTPVAAAAPVKERKPRGPSTVFSRETVGPAGNKIQIHSEPRCFASFINLGGNDHSLSLVSEKQGSPISPRCTNYVGFRDGVSQSDRIAITDDGNGSVNVQVVLHGDAPESSRTRIVPLETILSMIESLPR